MHNPEKNCKLIKFSPIETMPAKEADFLEEVFNVVAINYTDNGLEEYVGYASDDFDSENFRRLTSSRGIKLPPFTEEVLEPRNWLKENVIKFAPFETGDFMIYGIHETSCPKTDKIPVQVYAATAFGSEHQTTKMCLTAISELHARISSPQKILDMGTGSGILSIAAAKIWQSEPQIIAADIDEEAVDVTIGNAVTNNVENTLRVVLSDGYGNPEISQKAPYDLVFANILANPLKEMCSDAFRCLRTGGYYLISGFIDNQEKDITEHHLKTGFRMLKTYKMDNWRAILLQKGETDGY